MQLIAAPSNLGLRPLRPGHVPGAWRAPAALIAAGLLDALGSPGLLELPPPAYSPDRQPGTGLLNGHALRAFGLSLADLVRRAHRRHRFALVIGGDCSILLGALAGARHQGALSLVHIDGHSDFRHPGNHDPAAGPAAAAGMDLAMATGRGEPLATEWPDVSAPLVADRHVVQLGERGSRDPDFAWPDIADTAIDRIDVFEALRIGPAAIAARIATTLDRVPGQAFWIHLDVDVMDRAIMPAVDSPGSPGLDPADLVRILRPLVADRRCRGMTVTILDPDLDPDGRCAAAVVALLSQLPFPTSEAP